MRSSKHHNLSLFIVLSLLSKPSFPPHDSRNLIDYSKIFWLNSSLQTGFIAVVLISSYQTTSNILHHYQSSLSSPSLWSWLFSTSIKSLLCKPKSSPFYSTLRQLNNSCWLTCPIVVGLKSCLVTISIGLWSHLTFFISSCLFVFFISLLLLRPIVLLLLP
jgi:hypothetical protein